jgi:tRNA A37 threonylcarbamoyladenosine dehydratase
MWQSFWRTELLLGRRAMEALASARVAVFGLGGVGSWAAEALARSGVGAFLLVDDETISASNINRQIHATTATIGRPKVEAMRDRILDINPEALVEARFEHYSESSAPGLLDPGLAYVVDAIDTIARKVDLILRSQAMGLPIISSMGAGDKLDPTRLEVADIYATDVCPLAREMRKRLRRRGVRSLKVVFSREEPQRPFDAPRDGDEGDALRPGKSASPGSNAFVPPAFGLAIAAEIVKDIAARTAAPKERRND